ncbi:MAG TPA: cytochrome c oxidase subunit II [Streptosporangiaceae bacterium]|nr:cytochrome c oxidase subunit II [Streptosporangiaceae bacterium]
MTSGLPPAPGSEEPPPGAPEPPASAAEQAPPGAVIPPPPGAGEPARGRDGRGHIRRMLIIWAVLSVVCIALALVIVPLITPKSASSVAGFANLTILVFTVLAVPVALFVWVFVFYSLIVFREKAPSAGRVEDLEDGPPLDARPWQQITWLAITAALAIFLVGWGMFGFFRQTTDPPRNPLVVDVTGQQWTWTYYYPSLGVQSHVLDLPLNQPVEFRITSDDVLHGFAIDELGVAMDANPGFYVTAPIVTPSRLGQMTARCVELCGLYHTYMWTQVNVVTRADFTAWVAANGGNAALASAQGGA